MNLKCLGFLSKTKIILDLLALGEITSPILYLNQQPMGSNLTMADNVILHIKLIFGGMLSKCLVFVCCKIKSKI